ncbi:hypothetical protein BDY19DRAFT_981014 [Irpex rosettiformis]|uniref:Uncharacterized protein n=1 Tax=Irpex rosettiformis TaxID=378272 RepID=A0ACB8TM79_9APHY|nr:hypothetical protein BDY19DRAFT_981014 [Irpex rosettiformis]
MVHSPNPSLSNDVAPRVCVCIPRSLTFYPLFILYYSLTPLLIASTVPLPDPHPVAPSLPHTFTLSFCRDFLCYLFIDYFPFFCLAVCPSVLSR